MTNTTELIEALEKKAFENLEADRFSSGFELLTPDDVIEILSALSATPVEGA